MLVSRTLKTLAIVGLVMSSIAGNAIAAGTSAAATAKPKMSASACAKLKTDKERIANNCVVKKHSASTATTTGK